MQTSSKRLTNYLAMRRMDRILDTLRELDKVVERAENMAICGPSKRLVRRAADALKILQLDISDLAREESLR